MGRKYLRWLWSVLQAPPGRPAGVLCALPEAGRTGTEGNGVSQEEDLDPFASDAAMDAYLERLMEGLRRDGYLPARFAADRPLRGPRRCPQRNPRKRQLSGPQARRPTSSGKRPPRLRKPG